MSKVTKLTTGHSEVKRWDAIERRDAIDAAITDLRTLGDLLQIASMNEVEAIESETISHAAAMVFNRAHELKRLMAEVGVS